MSVNHTINLDWIQINTELKDSTIFGGVSPKDLIEPSVKDSSSGDRSLRKQSIGNKGGEGIDKLFQGKTVFKRAGQANKYYRDIYKIWHRGKPFGQLLVNSRDQHLIPVNRCQIEVQNNKLYEDGWLDDLQSIMRGINTDYHSPVRLDIAIDGGNFLWLYKELLKGTVQKIGRADFSGHHNNKAVTNGFYIGKGKSRKRIRIYNKSKELNKSNKNYIHKFWTASGLDTTKEVERLEIVIKNEESKKFPDLDFTALDKPLHLASVMKANMETFCEFRKVTADKNISRWPKINIVDWESLGATHLDKDSTRPSNDMWSAKVTIKTLWRIHFTTKLQFWYDNAFEIAINSDLVAWMSKCIPQWEKDEQLTKVDPQTGEIYESWIHHFKHYNPSEQLHIFEDKVA